MALILRIEGDPSERFAQVIRALPDGQTWLVSDRKGAVVIARNEGTLLREAIFSESDDGTWDVECLASEGVSELALQVLVAAALLTCFVAIAVVWWIGVEGLGGLVVGVVAACTLPAFVLAVGQWLLDPGRDVGAEAHLERAMRFAVAQVPGADLVLEPAVSTAD